MKLFNIFLSKKDKEELELLRMFKQEVAKAVGCNEDEYCGRILNGLYLLIAHERILLKELEEKNK